MAFQSTCQLFFAFLNLSLAATSCLGLHRAFSHSLSRKLSGSHKYFLSLRQQNIRLITILHIFTHFQPTASILPVFIALKSVNVVGPASPFQNEAKRSPGWIFLIYSQMYPMPMISYAVTFV